MTETLVLLPSLGSRASIWDAHLPILSRHFSVISGELPGHLGGSAVSGQYNMESLSRGILAMMDHHGVFRAHLCGVSLGGMLAMWLAAHVPERVGRLVVCCTSARLGPPEMWRDRAALVRAEGTGAVAPAVVGRWFTPEFAIRRPDLVAAAEEMVAATPAEGYAGCCEAIAEMDLTGVLSRVTAPTLVIAGARDPAIPVAHGEQIAALIPDARLAVVDDAAHLATVEQAGTVTAMVLDHLLAGDPAHETGMAVRRAVLGDSHVDAVVVDDLTEAFQDLITRYAWGSVWARPGLDRRTRSLVTLALLAALGREGELAMHVRAALRNGVTRAEISEVLLHTAVYAGVPAANGAYAVARRVLDEGLG